MQLTPRKRSNSSSRNWFDALSFLSRSSAAVGANPTAKSEREDQTEYSYTPESLHTLGVLESIIRESQSPQKICTRAIMLSWMVLFLQLLMTLFLASGYIYAMLDELNRLSLSWFRDCSVVDRCHYSSARHMICMARVSTLQMSSTTTKSCQICPPIDMFREVAGDKGLCDTTSSFGSIDGLARVYFDFWETTVVNGANGPFERICSEERQTSYYGLAGKKRTCIDCFGEDCGQYIHAAEPGDNYGTLKWRFKKRHSCRVSGTIINKYNNNWIHTHIIYIYIYISA